MEVDTSNNERNTVSLCPAEVTQSPSDNVSDVKNQERRGSSSGREKGEDTGQLTSYILKKRGNKPLYNLKSVHPFVICTKHIALS